MCGVSIIRNIIRRFEEREGITGVIICDSSGVLIESDIDIEISEDTSEYITSLISRAKQLIKFLKEGKLKFIRLETSIGEIMIASEEQLILIILKGKKRTRKQGDYDHLPFPYIYKPPEPPDDFAMAPQLLIRPILKEKDPEEETYCQFCGLKLTKEEEITHSCKKKPE